MDIIKFLREQTINSIRHLDGVMGKEVENMIKNGTIGSDNSKTLGTKANAKRKDMFFLYFLETGRHPSNPGLPFYAKASDEEKALHGDQGYIQSLHAPTFGKNEPKLPRKRDKGEA